SVHRATVEADTLPLVVEERGKGAGVTPVPAIQQLAIERRDGRVAGCFGCMWLRRCHVQILLPFSIEHAFNRRACEKPPLQSGEGAVALRRQRLEGLDWTLAAAGRLIGLVARLF